MCSVRIQLILVISILILNAECKSVKRNQKDVLKSPTKNDLPKGDLAAKAIKVKSKTVPSAILAIEIVDPTENTTSKSKNSKRTIGSQLGYGFQPNSYFVSNKPKFEYYKYSQHDIPPYQGNNYYKNDQISVQKSVEYDLGTQQSHLPSTNQNQQAPAQYYQPGTVLFTTLNQQGDVNQLSSQVPEQSVNANVPVVYLKIYSDQLSNSGLYPNLPDSHPYSNLNGVNLQSLLAGYLQNSQSDQNVQQVYTNAPDYGQQMYQIVNQEGYNGQNNDQNQEYYLNQPIQYHQNYQDQINQYQYQQYQQPQQVYQQQDNADNLPTHENYPDDAHTRVIFHSNNGGHFPEKQQSSKTNVIPSVSSYKSQHTSIPQAQSYSSVEFKASQPDYTLPQQQDGQGYYYYKTQPEYSSQGTGENGGNYQYSYIDIGQKLPKVNSQNTEIPYNYHAHSTNSKKRNVRRPSVVKKIAKIKEED